MADTDYGDDSYSADFDRAGRLVTTSCDGHVRLYDAGFKLIAKKPARAESSPSRPLLAGRQSGGGGV